MSPTELVTCTRLSAKTIKTALSHLKKENLLSTKNAPKPGQPNRKEYSIITGKGGIAIVQDFIWDKYLHKKSRKELRKGRKKLSQLGKPVQRVMKDFFNTDVGKELLHKYPIIWETPYGEAYDKLIRYRNRVLCPYCLENEEENFGIWKDNEIVCKKCAQVIGSYSNQELE